MRKYLVFLIMILFSFIFCSCEKVKNQWIDGKGLIQIKGEYNTFDNYLVLIKELNDKKLVYSFKKGKQLIFESDYSFSSLHRWYLIYDEKGLWFYSGDIGSIYWKRKENGTYQQVLLDKENILKYLEIMPKELKRDLEDWVI